MDIPAPWDLTGRGFIMMYRFPETFIRESCFVPDVWKEKKWSGLGYVMLVDYQESPVGPYRELLLIPGKTRFGESRLGSITKIYVDSVDSMLNGRNNWGIPKEFADFKWQEEGRQHIIDLSSTDTTFMEICMEPGSVAFPVDTRFLPIHLHQELYGHEFQVSPHGRGKGHFTLVKDIQINADFFPDLNVLEPLVTIYIDPFRLTFPVPVNS